MATDVSVAITARDNYSEMMAKLARITASFTTDVKGLQGQLDYLNKTKFSLKIDVDTAKRALKDYNKTLKDDATPEAIAKQKELQNALFETEGAYKVVSKAVRDTEKSIRNLHERQAKGQYTGKDATGGIKSLMQNAGVAAAARYVGNILGQVASTSISSAYGSEAGIMADSVLGGVGSGAAIGTMIAPGIGTAIGAAAGAALGAITGETKKFAQKDEFFKSLVLDKFNEYKQDYETSLTSGIEVAARREKTLLAFNTLFQGDTRGAQAYLDQVLKFATETPFFYDDLVGMSQVLKTFGYTTDEILPQMQKIGNAAAALGHTPEDMQWVATYIGRMKATDKTLLRYINGLIERKIPVYDYLSEALGKTKKEVSEMITKGLIPGTKAAKIISDYMGKSFAGSMEALVKSYGGMSDKLSEIKTNFEAIMGAAYTEERKKGLANELAWYEGPQGERWKKVMKEFGKWEAEQENKKQMILLEKLEKIAADDSMTTEEKYKEYLKARAEADADIARDVTEGKYSAEIEALGDIRDAFFNADSWRLMGYAFGEEATKGMRSATSYKMSDADDSTILGSAEKQMGLRKDFVEWLFGKRDTPTATIRHTGNAYGLSYVPYNGYLTYLHEGERVLTASQNREYKRGGGGGVVINMNGVVVREEADIERIANELYRRIREAAMVYSEVS